MQRRQRLPPAGERHSEPVGGGRSRVIWSQRVWEPHPRSVYQDPKLSALDQKRNRETETKKIQAAELKAFVQVDINGERIKAFT